MSSVWHAILDNFRPISVWGADLALFYWITHQTYGEQWNMYVYEYCVFHISVFVHVCYNVCSCSSSNLRRVFKLLHREPSHRYSYIQLGGMFILFLGTAIYNGSVKLPCFSYAAADDHAVDEWDLGQGIDQAATSGGRQVSAKIMRRRNIGGEYVFVRRPQ